VYRIPVNDRSAYQQVQFLWNTSEKEKDKERQGWSLMLFFCNRVLVRLYELPVAAGTLPR
jgi:hypothetical protein